MNSLSLLAAATLLAAMGAAHAHDHGHGTTSGTSASAPAVADGEVRKLDPAAGKLTLRHGPIASLEMPAMTMVFRVADPRFFDGLAVGDTVRFSTQRVDGAYTIMSIERGR